MFQSILRAKRANFFGFQGGEMRIDGGGVISPHGGEFHFLSLHGGGEFFLQGGIPPPVSPVAETLP